MLFLSLFTVYGFVGLLVEVFFTAAFCNNRRLVGHTYIWMWPVYGLGGLLLTLTNYYDWPLIVKLFIFTLEIYAVEYLSGLVLKFFLGICPWDYGKHRFSIHGLIRLDYFLFWFCLSTSWYFTKDKMWGISLLLVK